MTRDITERKRIEEALRLSEEKYRVLSENATDIVWMLDFNTERFTYFSPSIQTMRGYTPDEAMAIPLDQTLLPESYQRAKAVLKESLERESKRGTPGVVRLMVLQEHCKDGSIIDTEAKVKFTRDLYGHPTGIIGTTRDITKRKRVERRLQESEARYRLISENTGDVIWMYDLEASRYTYVSPSVERLRGYTPQEVLTQTMSESLTPDSMNVVSGLLPARILALESGNESVRTTTHEVDQPRRDGSIVPTEVVTTLVQNEAGKVVRIIGVTRDITERKRAQEALQIALTKYKMLFELFPLGIVVADESGLILESNLMAGKLLNLSPEHNLRLRINEINLKIVRPDGQPMRPQEYACVRALREKRRVENVVMEVHDHPSGQIKWISATATPLSLKGYGVVVAFSDITEIKQAEQALKESEERFRMTFYTSPDAISISRIDDGLYIEINDGFSKLVGYSREEVIGRTSIELSIWTSAEDRAELVRGLKERGFYENMETSFRRKDGSILTGLMSAKTITFDGKPHLIAIVRDITERNLAAQALKESEERFRLTFYTSPDAVNINRLDSGVYVDINDGFTQITGYTKEDVMGKTSLSLNLWCNLEDQQKMIRDFTETGHCENLEARFLRKDGTIIIGLLSARVISFHGVPHLICITRDITGRYTAEQQLRKLSMAVEQSPTIIVITDADGAIQYVNASFETITGYSRDEVVGQNPRILKSGQHDNDFYRSLWKTISAGKVWEGRLINRRKDGSLYTEEVTISPLRDASGRVVNYVAVKRDITEHLRLHEEREKLRE
ncbi:MAG: PAS domain S-box protein, partial [Chlorobiales bacterium]|nr:PAS domain S-box protein [Chlorobiales bacterium]